MAQISDDTRAKVSEQLAGALALLTAGLGVAAAFEGGLGRVALNSSGGLSIVVGLVIAGVLMAFVARALSQHRKVWLALIVTSLVLTAVGLFSALVLITEETTAYDKPSIDAKYDGKVLNFTATASLMKNDQELVVTVYGYPQGWDSIEAAIGEDRGSQLFYSSTGPTPEGKASVAGSVPLDPEDFELVEVRASRETGDLQCLGESTEASEAACATVWTRPREPVLSSTPEP